MVYVPDFFGCGQGQSVGHCPICPSGSYGPVKNGAGSIFDVILRESTFASEWL